MTNSASEQSFAEGALLLVRRGAIATVVLNRPERRNAVNQAMWRALPALMAAIEADPAVRVTILRGAGGTFSAGADIAEFAEVYADAGAAERYNELVRAAQKAFRDLPRPTLALVEGACVGGGCGLALACDLRFAAADARFGITPAKLGLAYSLPDTLQLVEKVGAAAAKDLLFSARLIGAPEALAISLVDRVAAPDALEAEAQAYAENLAALSQTTIRTAKTMVNAASDALAEELAPRFKALFDAAFTGADFAEGRSAFLEKRPPNFSPSGDR